MKATAYYTARHHTVHSEPHTVHHLRDALCVQVGGVVVPPLRQHHGEHCVAAGRRLVHVGGRHSACLVPLVDKVRNVLVSGHGEFGQVFHVRPQQRVLSNSKVSLVLRVEEIAYSLTVNLHVTHLAHSKQ